MSEELLRVLAFIGSVFLIGVLALTVCLIWCGVKERVSIAVYEWNYKHRFDKPPTADCYCKYCRNLDTEHNKCEYMTVAVGDNCFCWRADPLPKQLYEKK